MDGYGNSDNVPSLSLLQLLSPHPIGTDSTYAERQSSITDIHRGYTYHTNPLWSIHLDCSPTVGWSLPCLFPRIYLFPAERDAEGVPSPNTRRLLMAQVIRSDVDGGGRRQRGGGREGGDSTVARRPTHTKKNVCKRSLGPKVYSPHGRWLQRYLFFTFFSQNRRM